MISYTDVQTKVLHAVVTPEPRAIPLADAVGLATAADLFADESVPPFTNSAVDGYALRGLDLANATPENPVRLRVVAEVYPGITCDVPLQAGEAAAITTGCPVPEGADTVVMSTQVMLSSGGTITVGFAPPHGDCVRTAGNDVQDGELAVARGTVLTAAHIGVLSSLGFRKVPAYPRLRIGVLSTGSEVVEGTGTLAPAEIRDANRPMLLTLIEDVGCESFDLGIVHDDERLIAKTIEDAVDRCDVVITSGGVAAGTYDYVGRVLTSLGETQWFDIAIRPAQPFAFGFVHDTPVFGLPGNPVSAFVSFELFARPSLLQILGYPRKFRPEVTATAEETMGRQRDGKVHFDRVRLRYDADRFWAARSGPQVSNALLGLAAANGLALLPDGDGVQAGEELRVMRLDAPPDH